MAEREKRIQAFQEKNDGEDSQGMSGDSKSRQKTPGQKADSAMDASKQGEEDGSGSEEEDGSGSEDESGDEESDES